MKSNLTLQINSLEALERLIGNDSATEVEIRNSVVQKFAEKHLKPIADTVLSRIDDAVKQLVAEDIVTYKKDGWKSSVVLKDEYKALIQEEISKKIGSEIEASCAFATQKFIETLDDVVDKRVKRVGDEHITAFVNRRVSEKLENIKNQIL